MRDAAYEKYIHSPAWRRKANERLEMDNHICQVCGKTATDVHHLAYDNFGHEEMGDLTSLCRMCHQKAEEIYDAKLLPWAMEEKKPEGNNFMAAMRVDAAAVAPIAVDWLGNTDFDGLMRLRQPDNSRKYWSILRKAVDSLCRKRYSMNCVEDRTDMLLSAITNRIASICLRQIEHDVRNGIQERLHEIVMVEYAILEKWKDVAAYLGISNGTLQTLRRDDGTSFGPSMREAVLYYCGMDAVAGIRPLEGFKCLSDEDYEKLNAMANYMVSVSGTGRFRGEYRC